MAYVYRHIRLDKNEPFYIGIGSDSKYQRAKEKFGRSKFWKSIVSKTQYEIEIIVDGFTWQQACEKEKEFISLYGRKDLNSGTLVNLTDGGDGGAGAIRDDNFKKLVSQKMKGKRNALGSTRSQETKRKISEKMKVVYWDNLYDKEYENAKKLGFAK